MESWLYSFMKIVITQLFQGVYLCSSNYFHTMKYYHVGFMVIGNQFADARDAAKMLCGLVIYSLATL